MEDWLIRIISLILVGMVLLMFLGALGLVGNYDTYR